MRQPDIAHSAMRKVLKSDQRPLEIKPQEKSVWICMCGLSKNQPFCDGSHKGSGFTPVKFEATESKTVYFCGCKHTANPCFCDGSHSKL